MKSQLAQSLILCYHAVSATWPAPLSSTPAQFRAHCARLARLGYRGTTISEALAPGRDKRVAITFDDAYRSVVERAKPILDEFDFRATIYAPTGHIGAGKLISWSGVDQWIGGPHESELVPMTWDELRSCQADGWEIGSHTVRHPHLTSIGDQELADELGQSKEACERETGSPCRSLAYPYGEHDTRVERAAEAAGYESAVTLPEILTSGGPQDIPRIGVYRRDTEFRFKAKTSPAILAMRRTAAWPAVHRAVSRVSGRASHPRDSSSTASSRGT